MPSLRIHTPRLTDMPAVHTPEPSELRERLVWIVRLRWRASAAIVAVILLTTALKVVTQPLALLALALTHVLGNVAFSRQTQRTTPETPLRPLQDQMAAQIVFDLAVLTGLLHFSGGADNPFLLLSVFHMALAGMMLPQRFALGVGALATALYAAMIGGESLGLIPHHPLLVAGHPAGETSRLLWATPWYMVGYIGVYAMANVILILFVHDLVHRMRLADALRRQHEQVAQAQERLARIGSLVAGVAHTIRNPLHGVLSCIDMLQTRMDADDTNSAEILDLMTEGVNRIENVTSRLLVLAREAPAQEAPVDLGILVQDALQFAEVRASARDVAVTVELAPVPPMPAHAERLSEAVANLIDNAIDACRPGGKVTVRVLPMAAPLVGARIEVADTGHGIADEDIPKIFEPFFTTKPVGEGTGLGLAITRRVVEDLSGDIRVSSQIGMGTVFSIDLPSLPTAMGAG